MVDFRQVIPFYWAIPVALILFYGAVFGARFVRWLASFWKRLRNASLGLEAYFEKIREEKKAEGTFWYFSEMAHFVLFGFIFVATMRFIIYLFTLPPDVSIFDQILGDLTVPIVTLIIVYYILKTAPYVLKKAGGDTDLL